MSNIVEIPNALGDTGIGVGFYTRAEAARIARIPRRTLDAWRQKRIVLESIEWENEEGKREVGYTFDALVYLRLIRMLRENNIVLRKAVHAVSELTKRFGPPSPAWQSVRIFSWGDKFGFSVRSAHSMFLSIVPTSGRRPLLHAVAKRRLISSSEKSLNSCVIARTRSWFPETFSGMLK